MAGYTRQSVADIVPTAVVRAAPINAEYNKLRDAFAFSSTGTTGHKHDGSSDEGSYVPLIADLDGINKIAVDTTNNRHGVFVEVASSSVEQVRFQDGVIIPVTDNDIDLGSSTSEYKNVYVDGTAYIDTVSIGDNDYTVITNNAYTVTGNLTFDVTGNINLDADGGNVALQDAGVTYATFTSNAGNLILKSGTTTAATFTGANTDLAGTLDVTGATTLDSTLLVKGNTTLGDAVTDTVTYTARAVTNFLPNADATYDLGTSSLEWNNLWLDGTANVDTLQVDESATITANLSVGGNVNTTGNNTIAGNLTVNGNTTLGNAATDTVTITADVASNIIPSVDSTYTLGDSSNYWSNAYIDAITTTGNITVGGSVTVANVLDMTNGLINNVATPSASTDAANKGYVDTAINNLIGGAPGTLDTLNEIAAAINDDANVYTTLTTSIAAKLPLAGGTMTGNITMGGNTVTGLGTPTLATDAATKGYIDTIFGDTASAAASAAAAEAAYDSFDDRYLGAKSSSPAVDNDGNALITGALYFDTTANLMKVYDGSSWVDAGSAVNGTAERNVYTATSGQTVFSATYDVGYVDVYLNGVKLINGTDFTATNGTSITLTVGATAGDSVDIVAYGAFSIADVYTQAVSDSRFLRVSNNLSDITDAATARTNLGLVIGTDVQAYDATILNDADIGVTVQAYDATTLKAADIGVTVQGYDATILTASDIGVTLQAYDADTAKLDTAQTFTANQTVTAEFIANSYNEKYIELTSTSNSVNLDCETGNTFMHTLTEATTFTFSNPPASGTAYIMSIEIIQDASGSGYSVTWPTSVDWAGGTAPTLTSAANGVDVFAFSTRDGGTTWYGFTAGLDLK